jgi:hypothetical protein
MENLHGPLGEPDIDLLSQQGVWHGVIEPGDLNVIINTDPCQAPLGIFIVAIQQWLHCWKFDAVEQLAPAEAEMTHDASVELDQYLRDRSVAFDKGEELDMTQPTQNVILC